MCHFLCLVTFQLHSIWNKKLAGMQSFQKPISCLFCVLGGSGRRNILHRYKLCQYKHYHILKIVFSSLFTARFEECFIVHLRKFPWVVSFDTLKGSGREGLLLHALRKLRIWNVTWLNAGLSDSVSLDGSLGSLTQSWYMLIILTEENSV